MAQHRTFQRAHLGDSHAPPPSQAVRRAVQEEDFLPILGAVLTLIVTGTIMYTLGGDWSVVRRP